MLYLCLVIQRCLRGTPLGFCLRVIVNEKPPNVKKTTPSVLSTLLLIYEEEEGKCAGFEVILFVLERVTEGGRGYEEKC